MNQLNNMKKIFLVKNLSPIMFSAFLFLFAIEQALENINILYYIVLVLMILCVVLLLFSSVKSIVKDKQNFVLSLTSKSIFSFFDIGSALIGLIISYSLNSNLFKLWIFLLVINIITILIPHPYKKQ
jgi:hypothetical protein